MNLIMDIDAFLQGINIPREEKNEINIDFFIQELNETIEKIDLNMAVKTPTKPVIEFVKKPIIIPVIKLIKTPVIEPNIKLTPKRIKSSLFGRCLACKPKPDIVMIRRVNQIKLKLYEKYLFNPLKF